VTTFIPMMAGSTEPVAVVEGGTTDSAAIAVLPSSTDSTIVSSPTPTVLPDQASTPVVFSPPSPSATTVDSGSLGLGDPPIATPGAPPASDAPQGMDPVAERAMISVGSIGKLMVCIRFVHS